MLWEQQTVRSQPAKLILKCFLVHIFWFLRHTSCSFIYCNVEFRYLHFAFFFLFKLFDDKAGFRRNIRNTVKCQIVRLEGDEYQKSVYCYSIVVSHLFLIHTHDIVDFKHEWNLILPRQLHFDCTVLFL